MSTWNRSRWGWYFAPDKGAGSGTPGDEGDDDAGNDEGSEGSDDKSGEGEDDKSGDGEEGGEDDKSSDDDKSGDGEDEPKVRDLTDEEFEEQAKARGFVKPEPKTDPAPIKGAAPLKIVDYRGQAFKEVQAAANAKEEGWVDDEGELTEAGLVVAENHAIALASQGTVASAQEAQKRVQLQAQRPEIASRNETHLKEKMGVPEEVAGEVAKTMTDILVDSYGPDAFDYGESEPDPAAKEQKQQLAQRLWTTAYYTALGIAVHKSHAAKAEGGDKGDKPAEKPGGSGGSDGLYSGLSKEDREWIEKVWVPERNSGKPPTAEQLKTLKEKILA